MAIRAKITPTTDEAGSIRLKIDWIDVKDSQPGEVLASEEIIVAPQRQGCSYLSRAEFAEGTLLPGTFWVDEEGKRHFFMQAEAGIVGLIGKAL